MLNAMPVRESTAGKYLPLEQASAGGYISGFHLPK
jgi:hypothetical protein